MQCERQQKSMVDEEEASLNTQRALQHRFTLHRVDILTACSSSSAVPKMLLSYIYIWPEYVCYLSAGAVHLYQCNYWK